MCNTYVNIQTGEELDLDRVNELKDNAMLKVKPELWIEWDFEKNDELEFDIWKVARGSGKNVWWICNKHNNHKWRASVKNRITENNNCGYCSNKRLLVGFNDIWTTNPKLASSLVNPEDGFRYMQNSREKVDWKCPDCGSVNKAKIIQNVNRRGLSCSKCSDGISYPEKFLVNLLDQLNVNFNFQQEFNWSSRKKYDFYNSSLSCIIEVHGEQHYERGFSSVGGRTYLEEQENDRLKEQLAKENGVKNYIIIDARNSELEWIKNNILNSKLNELFDLSCIDWEDVHKNALKSLVKVVCDLWNDGMKSTTEIIEKLNLSRTTIIKYLKQGVKIGWCDYNVEKIQYINGINIGKKRIKEVVQLNEDGLLMNIFDSMTNASSVVNRSYGNISNCCRGKAKTSGGYQWMYKDDYEKYIEEQKHLA